MSTTTTTDGPFQEYRSPTKLLGLPLVHIKHSRPQPGQPRRIAVARGWVAIGDIAFGPLLAMGGIAFGGIALGGVAIGALALAGIGIGIVSFAGIAVGGLCLGGMSVGAWAIGGLAVGYLAFGGMAVAIKAAKGGMAIANEFAVGGGARALEANTAAAREFIASEPFFAWSQWIAEHSRHAIWLNLLWVIPLLANVLARRRCAQARS